MISPKAGATVVVSHDCGTAGYCVVAKHINARKPIGSHGMLVNPVPGHGGDVWAVMHGHSVAVYALNELEYPMSDQPMSVAVCGLHAAQAEISRLKSLAASMTAEKVGWLEPAQSDAAMEQPAAEAES